MFFAKFVLFHIGGKVRGAERDHEEKRDREGDREERRGRSGGEREIKREEGNGMR